MIAQISSGFCDPKHLAEQASDQSKMLKTIWANPDNHSEQKLQYINTQGEPTMQPRTFIRATDKCSTINESVPAPILR